MLLSSHVDLGKTVKGINIFFVGSGSGGLFCFDSRIVCKMYRVLKERGLANRMKSLK